MNATNIQFKNDKYSKKRTLVGGDMLKKNNDHILNLTSCDSITDFAFCSINCPMEEIKKKINDFCCKEYKIPLTEVKNYIISRLI